MRRTAEKLCVADYVADCIWLGIPQPAEWQHIGNKIDAAFIFARHFSRSFPTVAGVFAAKPRDSAQCTANGNRRERLASETLCKATKSHAKLHSSIIERV